jgi:hypothetical protein
MKKHEDGQKTIRKKYTRESKDRKISKEETKIKDK